MINFLAHKKPLARQSSTDKMVLLKLLAEQKLGSKWIYFKKIKHSDEGFSLLKNPSLMDQMKATQSALRFTSKTARKAYWSTFKAAVADVKSKGEVKAGIPGLPEVAEGAEVPTLSPRLDAFIVTWTPIKFLLNAKLIRDKGVATQRHSEGLVAKLMFKVVAYYADPNNWDVDQLCFYLRKLTPESDYQAIVAALEPLKKDLLKLADTFAPFKFGKSSLAKDAAQEADTYDDAFGEEPMSEQVQTLYLYHFIYEGLEQFLLKYFSILCLSTPNKRAIRYLATMFEPVIGRAIENKNVFLGSFETDRSKRAYGVPYDEYCQSRLADLEKEKIKTQNNIYESWVYNLPFLQRYSFSYSIKEPLTEDSGWAVFLQSFLHLSFPASLILTDFRTEVPPPSPVEGQGASSQPQQEEAYRRPEIELVHRWTGFSYILNQLLLCSQAKRHARSVLLERFKKRVLFDREMAQKRVGELRKQAEKKIREMTRKVKKLRRLKQEESAKAFEADIAQFHTQVEQRGQEMIASATQNLAQQKRRFKALFEEVAREKSRKMGVSTGYVVSLAHQLDFTQTFQAQFTEFVCSELETEYLKELEPFYANLFEILHPKIEDKVNLVKVLDSSAPDNGVRLTLSAEEKTEIEARLERQKKRLETQHPGIFETKLWVSTGYIPVEGLLSLSLSNPTWGVLFEMKFVSAKKPKPTQLDKQTAKALIALNKVINPIRLNDLRIPGRQKIGEPENRINMVKLNKLYQKLEQQKKVQ